MAFRRSRITLRELKAQAQHTMNEAEELIPIAKEGLELFKKLVLTGTTLVEEILDGFEISAKWGNKILPFGLFIDPSEKESENECDKS